MSTPAAWLRASYCQNGECAEVAIGDGTVLVRDSKDPDGPQLKFTRAEWQAFTSELQAAPGIPGAGPQPALPLPGVLPGDGSPLAHALRRLAAGQADPGAADPIACHDSYM